MDHEKKSDTSGSHSRGRPTEAPHRGLLEQHRLALKDLERLLEARNIRLASPHTLFIRLRLRDALVLQLREVLEDRVELRGRRSGRRWLRRSSRPTPSPPWFCTSRP